MDSESCKTCKNFFLCDLSKFLPFPENGCSDYVSSKKKRFALVHHYCDTGFNSIVAFSNDFSELYSIRDSQPHFGSLRHSFLIVPNYLYELKLFGVYDDKGVFYHIDLNDIKDSCLLRICENVAFGLSRAEYHMLKHRYTKSKFCFDKTFMQISHACNILENY